MKLADSVRKGGQKLTRVPLPTIVGFRLKDMKDVKRVERGVSTMK